jgi:hypothetical protein
MTALTRLHEKGAGTAAAQMRELLGSGADRETVLARFVDSLSEDEEKLLVELLREAQAEGVGPQ